MPLTAAFTNAFKNDLFNGVHETSDTYKIALVKPSSVGTIDKTFASYTSLGSDEVANGNGYTTGGQNLVGFSVTQSGDTVIWDWTTDPSWAGATFSAAGAIIYNDTSAGKRVLAVLDFGGTITATAGTFTVQLPAPGASTGLIRIA